MTGDGEISLYSTSISAPLREESLLAESDSRTRSQYYSGISMQLSIIVLRLEFWPFCCIQHHASSSAVAIRSAATLQRHTYEYKRRWCATFYPFLQFRSLSKVEQLASISIATIDARIVAVSKSDHILHPAGENHPRCLIRVSRPMLYRL